MQHFIQYVRHFSPSTRFAATTKTWRLKHCSSAFYVFFRRVLASEKIRISLAIKHLAATSFRDQSLLVLKGPSFSMLRDRAPAFGKTCPDPCPCADGRPIKLLNKTRGLACSMLRGRCTALKGRDYRDER